MKNRSSQRRAFLKQGMLAALALGLPLDAFSQPNRKQILEALEKQLSPPTRYGESVIGLKHEPIKQVKVAFIGLGNRGSGLLRLVNALYPDKAKVTAICDIRKERIDRALGYLKENKGQQPDTYYGTPSIWKEMVRRDDIDLVIIATPWEEHAPMAVYSMQQGKHTAVEVPTTVTLQECWDIVNTAEETQRNCMILENVCYGNEELWVLNMAENGVFGTLTYAECSYIHDLRRSLFSKTNYYNQWRMKHHIANDGNLYPTHGLGPVAQYLGIQRGDSFEKLVSMSSREAALSEYAQTVEKDNPFYGRTEFAHGDMNTSLIRTARGRMITLKHDVATPRPYSRINALAGTKGYHEGYPSRLFIDGGPHEYLDDAAYKEYREKYDHPIWKSLQAEIEKNGGHGGMDFVMIYRLIDCLNNGWPLDMDVYDAAAWSVITPLSTVSIELGNVPVKFPDFTRGAWKEKRALGILAYS